MNEELKALLPAESWLDIAVKIGIYFAGLFQILAIFSLFAFSALSGAGEEGTDIGGPAPIPQQKLPRPSASPQAPRHNRKHKKKAHMI